MRVTSTYIYIGCIGGYRVAADAVRWAVPVHGRSVPVDLFCVFVELCAISVSTGAAHVIMFADPVDLFSAFVELCAISVSPGAAYVITCAAEVSTRMVQVSTKMAQVSTYADQVITCAA